MGVKCYPPQKLRGVWRRTCNNPNRLLKMLSAATSFPKFLNPNRLPKIAK